MILKKVINGDQSGSHEPPKGKWATHIFGRLVWPTPVIISDLPVTCQNLFNGTDSAIIGAWCASEVFFFLLYFSLSHLSSCFIIICAILFYNLKELLVTHESQVTNVICDYLNYIIFLMTHDSQVTNVTCDYLNYIIFLIIFWYVLFF